MAEQLLMEINPANRLPMGGLADRAPSSQGYQGVPRATGFSPSSPGRLSASPPDQRIALNLAQGNLPPNFAGSPPDGCRGRPVTLTAGSSPLNFPCPVSGSSLAVTPPGGLDLIPHLHQVSYLCNDVVSNLDFNRQYQMGLPEIQSRDTPRDANKQPAIQTQAEPIVDSSSKCTTCWQLMAYLQKANLNIQQLTTDLNKVIDKNQEWQKYREKVDVKLSETKKHIQELGQEKRTALDQVTKLQDELLSAQKEMSGKGTALTTRQLSEMDHLHTQMKDKMSQVDEENTQLKASASHMSTQIHDHEETIRRLQQQLKDRCHSNGKQVAENEERIGVLQQQIEVLTEDFRQEQNDKQTEYARAESLHRQLAQLKRQLNMGTPALSRSQSSPHQNLHQQQSVPNNYRQVGMVGGMLETDGPGDPHNNYGNHGNYLGGDTSPFSMPVRPLTSRGGGYDVPDSAVDPDSTRSLQIHLIPRMPESTTDYDAVDGPPQDRGSRGEFTISQDEVDEGFIMSESPVVSHDHSPRSTSLMLNSPRSTSLMLDSPRSTSLMLDRLDEEDLLQCPKCHLEFPVSSHHELLLHTDQCR